MNIHQYVGTDEDPVRIGTEEIDACGYCHVAETQNDILVQEVQTFHFIYYYRDRKSVV